VNSSVSQALSRVISTSEVMPGTCLIWLESPQIAPIAKPGQFVMLRCGEDTLLRRPFSIHQVNNNGIALLFSVVGRGTQWLSECKIGDNIDLLGPLGNGYSIAPDSRNILLVAGGVGVAPIYFLADCALKKGIPITLGIGMNTGGSLSTLHEMVSILCSLCKDNKPLVKIVPFSEDGTYGIKGLVTSLCKDCKDFSQIFACGPSPMYRTMAKMPELRDKPVQISLEVRMGCGLGVCYGCTVKTKQGLKQICQDGPIFELGDIVWDEFVDI